MEQFDQTFGKYKLLKGKFKSVYTFIVYNMEMKDLLEKVDHQMAIIKLTKDNFKRAHRLEKMYNFKNYLTGLQEVKFVNSIFIINESIVDEPLLKEWKDILIEFDVPAYTFLYGEEFDYDYVKNLLTDNTFFDVLHVNNNTLIHYHMNKTKKKIHNRVEKKALDVSEYISSNLKNKCIVHGISSLLKDVKTEKHLIFNKLLKDDELFNLHERETNKQLESELKEWLGNLLHPKLGSRIVFGKDVTKKISQKLLQKVYCTTEMRKKLDEKIPNEYKIFQINEVKSFEIGDMADKLAKEYAGIIGITFY
jgi:hypothetical protein